MKVYAFSGWKFSGKDSCVNFLNEKYGFQRVSFADPLKSIVASSFSIPVSWLNDPERKEKPILEYPVPAADKFTKMVSEFMVREFRTSDGTRPEVGFIKECDGVLQTYINNWENLYHTPRSLAILIGSSMRAGSSSFWVRKAIENIDNLQKSGTKCVAISDLRYQSEVKQLKEAFGKNLVTVRVNRFDTSPSVDPSENDLNDYKFDFVLENKGTKEELFAKLDSIVYL